MKKTLYKFLVFLILTLAPNYLSAEIVNDVKVTGNERISEETIIVYGEIKKNNDYSQDDINDVIKKLYDTKFFSKISVTLSNGILNIKVAENPLINTIIIEGEKAKKFIEAILDILSLKEKSS